ncbi:hypothetical protein [Halalkaliarchaeum desulfuricum]|nr:hypothetical protein [Halalkaliarchaeum desulfuricum]
MPTIRVREWTKDRIEEIRNRESHSSHDSVIKSLLKDRELAKFASPQQDEPELSTPDLERNVDKEFESLTVFSELQAPEDGIIFLWCPQCVSEIAHLTVEDRVNITQIELGCQNCLHRLDQHALVAIEIGYPIEQKLVEEAVEADLKRCVVDYWDRTLESTSEQSSEAADVEDLVWAIDQYCKEFNWACSTEYPAVSIQAGRRYRDEVTGETLEVLELVSADNNQINSYRIRRFESASADSNGVDPEVLSADEVVELIADRRLTVIEDG